MKLFIITILISLSLPSMSEENTITYKILGKNIKFYNYPSLKITVSKPCPEAQSNKICSNLSFLNTISFKKLAPEGTEGKNPSSVICSKQLNGKVYIGTNLETNNENSFCKLKDATYVDSGTLSYYADKNDGYIQKPRLRKRFGKNN